MTVSKFDNFKLAVLLAALTIFSSGNAMASDTDQAASEAKQKVPIGLLIKSPDTPHGASLPANIAGVNSSKSHTTGSAPHPSA